MLRRNLSKALDFVGSIVASGNPKILLDGGPTYDEFDLVTNLEADEFTFIVSVDGERRVEMTGTEMLAREAYDGRPATSGHFRFSFVDALARSLQGENMTGLVTRPGQRVLVELVIASSVTPVTPTARLVHVTSPNRVEEFRLFCIPELVPVTTTGDNQFSGFRRGSRPGQNYIRRIFGYGAITYFELEHDRTFPYGKGKLLKADNDAYVKANGKTVPSSCYVVDFIASGNVVIDMLDTYTVEALRAVFTTSDSNNIRAQTEYVQDVRPVAAAR